MSGTDFDFCVVFTPFELTATSQTQTHRNELITPLLDLNGFKISYGPTFLSLHPCFAVVRSHSFILTTCAGANESATSISVER